jgi:hypothetical protein
MQTGSNGFALAPAKQLQEMRFFTSIPYYFYFRPEIQMSSEEGLNAYGAVTWGNFHISRI